MLFVDLGGYYRAQR